MQRKNIYQRKETQNQKGRTRISKMEGALLEGIEGMEDKRKVVNRVKGGREN